mgnify:CR=1 FL=1
MKTNNQDTTTAQVEVELQQPDENGKMVINHMPVIIRSVDRSRKDIADWWTELQNAESVYYPNVSGLFDIYSTVRIDTHLGGIIEKRISSVINKKLYFKKGGNKIDSLDDLIKSETFKELRRELRERKFWGRAGFEFIVGPNFAYNVIPKKHIRIESQTIASEQYDSKGTSYKGVWNLWVLGKRDDFGLLLSCTPYALWKKGNMGDWAMFVEIFGQPFIIFTYDAHDKKTKEELDTIMKNIGSGTKLQVPKQVQLKLEDGKQSNANGDLQEKLRVACNNEMSVRILGATETTTSSSSSGYAQSKEHAEQQDEIILSDMEEELSNLNDPQFLSILKSYGYDVDGGEFCYEKNIDLAKVKQMIDIVKACKELGLPVDDDYLYELTGIPKPKNYEALKREIQQNKKPADPPTSDPVRPEKKGHKGEKKMGKEKLKGEEAITRVQQKTENFITQVRQWFADFFDPAHKG